MSIIRLRDNNQIRIALKYVSAKESHSKTGAGMEYLYTLSDGNLIYVSAQGHAEIQSLKPLAGEFFLLAKTVGKGSAILWSVERIEQPKPVATARTIAATVPIPPSLTTPESRRIFSQLVATIQAVKAAEEFSVSINRPVTFSSEDIRAMGISGFIEQSRRVA